MRILVVDDEEMAIKMVELQLKRDGHEVVSCTDGKQAIDIINADEPDLVISDIMMPYMSGLELLEIVKTEHKKIPVILISALDEVEVVQTSIDMGADDFIIKPLNMEELSLRVKLVLQKTT
jgi:DNA-binding response OmpR family regulator